MPYQTTGLAYAIFGISLSALILSSLSARLHAKKSLPFLLSSISLVAISLSSYILLVSSAGGIFLGTFRVYPFSLLFAMLVSFLLFLVNVLAFQGSDDYGSFLTLFGFAALGMFSVIFAYSLLAIFIGIEAMIITTSLMAVIEHKHHVEAAVKLFIMGSIAAAAFAFGLSLLLPFSSSLSLSAISSGITGSGRYLVSLSLILIAAALSFEAGLFPFNLWLPDVYEGSPAYLTAMMSGVNKKVAFAAILSMLFITFGYYLHSLSLLLVLLAASTMLFGNLLALVQTSVKRMMAYSSISQAGYIMVGIAVATQYGIESSIFQIFAHAFMAIGAFSIILWLEKRNIKTIGDYSGLASRNGFTALSLTIILLSLAGIPPLAGFDGKFLLFTSAAYSNLVLLAFFGVINSFISLYYYWKVISSVYSERYKPRMHMETGIAFVILVSVLFIVLVGVYPQPLLSLAGTASRSLLSLM